MWIDVRGEADCSLNEAINAYGGAGLAFLPAIALATNASVEDAQPKIAYDNTPDHDPREYFQSFVPERIGIPLSSRPVDVEATFLLIKALNEHPDGERLRRATEAYRLAISHWIRGQESLALMHLFMGMETLTTSALRRECNSAGLDEADLARSWDIDVDGAPVKSVWRSKLEAEVRRRVLFQGDVSTHAKAKRASDGLEHGFLDFTSARTLAEETRDQTATYLREAIFEVADVDDGIRQRMLVPPYDKPLKSWLAKYLRGDFLGDADDLAAPDQQYPMFRWHSKLKELKRTDTGGYTITPDENMTAVFNDQVKFQPKSFEVWGPEGAKPAASTPDVPEEPGETTSSPEEETE
jgi:hypothetical protein